MKNSFLVAVGVVGVLGIGLLIFRSVRKNENPPFMPITSISGSGQILLHLESAIKNLQDAEKSVNASTNGRLSALQFAPQQYNEYLKSLALIRNELVAGAAVTVKITAVISEAVKYFSLLRRMAEDRGGWIPGTFIDAIRQLDYAQRVPALI
jgi:hypothetical protein